MIPSSPYYYMFSFLSPSKKRMFVLVRLLFRPDFEKRQALQQHTHTFFFRDGCSKRQKKLFLTTKILRLRALPRGLFVQKKRIIHESSSSSQKKANKLVFQYKDDKSFSLFIRTTHTYPQTNRFAGQRKVYLRLFLSALERLEKEQH